MDNSKLKVVVVLDISYSTIRGIVNWGWIPSKDWETSECEPLMKVLRFSL